MRDARNLWRRAALPLFAALAALAAGFLTFRENTLTEHARTPTRFFPQLGENLQKVQAIRIITRRGLSPAEEVQLEKKGDHFVVRDRWDYPANRELVRRLLSGMARLERHEKRTAEARHHGALGLVAPNKLGGAMRIQLSDEKGEMLADILLGKRPEGIGKVLGENAIYARKYGEDASWLARGALPLKNRSHDWLAFPQRALSTKDIQSVWLQKENGKRKKLAGKDKESVLKALDNSLFHDVRPLAHLAGEKRFKILYQTKGGGESLFAMMVSGERVWVRMENAQNGEGMEKLLEDWAFEISPQDATPLLLLFEKMERAS